MEISSQQGLMPEEVIQSRNLHGRNILSSGKKHPFRIFLDVLREPMMLLLIVAALVYFFTGEQSEGFLMLASIGIVAGISIYQEIRSENATHALKQMTQSLVMVIRSGEKSAIPSQELVVNDIMIVSEGEHISADACIIDSNDCSVNEAILTGESFAVDKGMKDPLLFAGTVMLSGLAHAKVTAVGEHTRLGQLGKSLEQIQKEKTPLQQQIAVFVRRMAVFGVIAFLLVWIYNTLASGDLVHGLLHGLTLAMAALPEEIPVALSTFMALGAYRMIRMKVLTRHPQTVESLGSATVICVDKTGTLTENKMVLVEVYAPQANKIFQLDAEHENDEVDVILEYARLASEPLPFDPMEKAIVAAYEEPENFRSFTRYKMIHEYPLSGISPMMTHIYEDEKGKRFIACKGAPEGIVKQSALEEIIKKKVISSVEEMASRGYRVLAVAKEVNENRSWPTSQDQFRWEFLGLIAFSDPPKKNSADVIRNFHRAGISVKMITGDFPETAKCISGKVGIQDAEHCLTGPMIMNMSDENLQAEVKKVNVFARMLPEAKLRVIQALIKNGEVVAMTGDGVNDGPALKAAHIGIAMGQRGSEIARQAASLILIDDDLGNMVGAIGLGRKIYSNLKKAIQYIISIHIPLISIVTLPLLFGWKYPNIFSPIHVIFFELIMGPTCSIAFENEPMESDAMERKPRKMTANFFTWSELSLPVIQGGVIALGLLLVMYISIISGHEESHTRTLVFSTLIFANVLLTLTGRSRTETIITGWKVKNNLIPIMIFISLAITFTALFLPIVRGLFEFVSVQWTDILKCAAVAGVSVLWIELLKMLRRERE